MNLAQLIHAAVQTLSSLLASGDFIIPFFISLLTLNQYYNSFQHSTLNGKGWMRFWGEILLLV